MARFFAFFFFFALVFAACTSPPSEGHAGPEARNKFSDSTHVLIHEAQDHRDAAALREFLKSEESRYRAEAAEAFGSVQDTGSVPQLIALLQDHESKVVQAAAWALGQTGHVSAADALLAALGATKDAGVALSLGEAIGKCGDSTHLAALLDHASHVKELAEAAMQGVYRFGLRGMRGEETAAFALWQLQSTDSATVLYASAYLARNRQLAPFLDAASLVSAYHRITDPDALQHLVRSFGQVDDAKMPLLLMDILASDSIDYRVKVSAVRAMADSPRKEYLPLVRSTATSHNIHLAYEAANYLLAHTPTDGEKSRGNALLLLSRQAKDWRSRATMLKASIKVSRKEGDEKSLTACEQEAQLRFDSSANPYEKGHCLLAMSESPRLEAFLVEKLLQDHSVLKTYSMEALSSMYTGTSAADAGKRIAHLNSALEMDDVGVTAQVAALIRQEKELLAAAGEGRALREALERLRLPEDIETYNEIERTLAAIDGSDHPELKTVTFNNPIDWDVVKAIPADQVAVMKLAGGGEIRLQLLVEKAPATVANFVAYGLSHFYRNAVFHRVVPNFVAQGGDPRGDGWGSTPNTIRSEWPELHYGEGYMGMASAGKDTESCQWFITHCSTPHLDGRYTIFAKVISGMDLLHQVQIGDHLSEIIFPGLKLDASHLQ